MSFVDYLCIHYQYQPIEKLWYSKSGRSNFNYSDSSEVEERILSILSSANDVSSYSIELRNSICDWPTLYHLSPNRSNLLRPFVNDLKGEILELGAGFGAITRFLAEQGGSILAVEGSARRAKGASLRCKDLKNVQVVVDTFDSFNLPYQFDVVVMIGVLEYAQKYFPKDNQYDGVLNLLKKVNGFLKKNGLLIIAIENQLGLKYFCGSPEDHYGIPFLGINDAYPENNVMTFGRKELKLRLKQAGFEYQKWWYAFPDYKLPVCMFSSNIDDEKIEYDFSPIIAYSSTYDPQKPQNPIFSLEQTWSVVLRNGVLSSLANSFLVMAKKIEIEEVFDDRVCCYYSTDRRKEFAKEVVFRKEIGTGRVRIEKRLLFPQEKIEPNIPLSMQLENEETVVGQNWQWSLIKILNKPNWSITDITEWARVWLSALSEYISTRFSLNTNFSVQKPLLGDLFDAVPRNLVVLPDGQTRFIDQKWRLSLEIEFGYLLFRGIFLSILEVSSVECPLPGTPVNIFQLFKLVTQQLGFWITPSDFSRFLQMESDIQKWALEKEVILDEEAYLGSNLNIRLPVSKDSEQMAQILKQLAEREQALEGLRAELIASRERAALLEGQLAERDQQNTALTLQKASLQQELDSLRSRYENLQQHQQERGQILQNLNNTLLEIYSSTAWKIIQWMWRVRLWLAPRGSWREKIGRKVFSLIRFAFRSNPKGEDKEKNNNNLSEYNASKSGENTDGSINNIQTGNQIEASIIIPVFNAVDYTKECIFSIYQFTKDVNFEVVVIDNASTDSTKEWFEKEKYQFPNLTYISLDENIGFGPAVNIGFRNSKGRYLVVLNNDTLVSPHWLSNLLEFMGEDPSIGIISPVTNYVGEGPQIDEDAINMSSRLDFIADYALKISMRKELIYEPNRLVFFCVVIRRDLIDLIGYLDENYIKGNFEDDDYCMRARLAGYKLAIAKNSFVYHKGSITFKINQISHTQYMQANREKFFLKAGRLSTSFYLTKYSNNKKGELSVIVRTKDRPVLLKNALNSLANQTYRGFEVVLVNDGGVDVKDLVEKFSDFFPIKYIIHKTPKGRTAAINTGLTNATGKWIAYLDDDDILYPWHFESLLSVHDLSHYHVIYGDYNRALFLDQTGRTPLKLIGVPPWEFNRNELLIGNYIPIHSYIHLKECIDSIGFWDESLNRLEDYEFLVRLASFGNFRHVKKVVAEYRIYLDADNSITGRGRSEYLNSLEYIYNRYPLSDEKIRKARETAIQALRDQIQKIQEIQNRLGGIEACYEIMKIVFGF